MRVQEIIFVMLGGAIGAAARYSFASLWPAGHSGIFAANIVGCALLGTLTPLIQTWGLTSNHTLPLLMVTGFCGSLTTFSALIGITHAHIASSVPLEALIYVGLSLFFGLFCFWTAQRLTIWLIGT